MLALLDNAMLCHCYLLTILAMLLSVHTGVALPYPLSDQRPLPTNLPDQLLASEGALYYLEEPVQL